MKELYQKRKQKQINHLMKYYRYVFNDHFTMILFFAFGGFLYFYSQVMREIQGEGTWLVIKSLLPLFYLVFLFFGHLATYSKHADAYYLLPKEKDMVGYLKKAFWYSLWLPFGFLLFAVALSYPLLKGATNLSLVETGSLLLFLISMKGFFFLQQIKNNYQEKDTPLWWLVGLSFIGLYVSTFVSFIGVAIIGILTFSYFYVQTFKEIPTKTLYWQKMIEKETQRMKKIYGFISLFTDVPEMPTQVKRRRYLDLFLNKVSKKQKETYTYLFLRRLVRGQEFSSLFLSLTSFTLVIFFIFQNFIGNLLAGLLFIYLLGFQLLPLYDSFDYMTLTQLYPLDKKIKSRNFQKVLLVILLVEGFIFVLANLFILPITNWLIFVGVLLLEIFLFDYIYAPKRLQKGKA